MIQFDLPKQKSSIIKVIGVGGGGSNAVNFMFAQNIDGVDFIICNTDAKAIEQSLIPNKIQLGPYLTQGLGAGANPEVGKAATEESLDEIRRILEVNTKMAFITVGMGGGTGTGGAPIIAKVCRELGILTVGIVTTPFSFEGPKRKAQAIEGINELKPYVDTLLVISNDKLRMQYGNLKMKEAFSKADNVLATAAKCITDIINSRGHIIVDFADVCTVMKSGGVAILGKAEAEGEDRAQRAIEEALSSPLLNDSDIKGAKWILININSAEGDHECTMDEMDIISNYLRMQAGEKADVIMGMGYDPTLDSKIGITLIATGFDAKDPFEKPNESVASTAPEKIVMTLQSAKTASSNVVTPQQESTTPQQFSYSTPLVEEIAPKLQTSEQNTFIPTPTLNNEYDSKQSSEAPVEDNASFVLEIKEYAEPKPAILSETEQPAAAPTQENEMLRFVVTEKPKAANPVISKPANIYSSQDIPAAQPNNQNSTNSTNTSSAAAQQENEAFYQPQSRIAQPQFGNHQPIEKPAAPSTPQQQQPLPSLNQVEAKAQQAVGMENEEEQRRKTQERLQKLRNLSYNINAGDPNNDFEVIPAYIRQKMELFGNAFTTAEAFYSNVTVSNNESNGNTEISTLNTFLEGKKPD